MHSPSEPTSTNTVQDPGGPWFPGTHAPRDSPSLVDSSEEGSAFSETGHPLAPVPWTGCRGFRRPIPGSSSHYHFTTSTVHKTDLFAEVKAVHRIVFLSPWGPPEMFDQSRDFLPAAKVGALAAPSTLKGLRGCYCTHHDPIEGKSVGKHDLVVRLLRGARRLNIL